MRTVAALFPLVLCCLSPAQTVRATAVSVTPMTVRTPLSSKSVGAPRDLTPGLNLALQATGMNVSTIVSLNQAPTTGPTYRIVDAWSVLGTYRGVHGGFGTGAHATRLTLTASQTVNGRLRVTAASSVRNGSTVAGTVDVGADGTVEFAVAPGPFQSLDLLLTVGPAGVVIETRTQTAGTTDASATTWGARVDLSIAFLPALACTATVFGSTCGPTIDPRPTFAHDLEVTLRTLRLPALGYLLLGIAPAGPLPLPAPGCGFVLVQPLVAPGAAFDAGGAARFVLPVPRGVPVRFFAQGMVLFDPRGTPALLSTKGLDLACP
ncbi:MAG: hypothetical protein AAF628_21950 [Planctomycetota bacterium]